MVKARNSTPIAVPGLYFPGKLALNAWGNPPFVIRCRHKKSFTSQPFKRMWIQQRILLKARPRGFHLVTAELLSQLPELSRLQVGLAHFFIQHTSASLLINENADPDVRTDLESHLRCLIPDGAPHFSHQDEGPDDMPGHIKSSLIGAGLIVPVNEGKLRLGAWQGIYLGEHRKQGGPRSVVATLFGEPRLPAEGQPS
jgi:secondary thiamine-phosphate synthase enzyme